MKTGIVLLNYNTENDIKRLVGEIIKSEFDKNDLMIMGNLKYFYMIEKIIGKTGEKLLEHSTLPIFIG